jgi:hypothetical protein
MLVFSGLLLKLLAEPTTVLFGDSGDQPAGVFVVGLEGFENGQLGAGITGQHELFEQVIEMADQSIPEAESVLPGQASMIGSSPLLAGLGSEGMDMGRVQKNREAPTAPRGT